MRATAANRDQSSVYPYLICLAASIVPGAGHIVLGRIGKGLVILCALTGMFAFGLRLEGRLFPIEIS